ncbi:MAG: GTPase ObgE [Parasporobacterium sp.]|nr:GTPase ObgE [Parasporobacterium sp.]
MFVDSARIIIKSGKGGDGHVSFRREKFVPDGGPDGGDGGNGGDIVFLCDENINTLIDFKHKRKYAAESGEEGGKKRMHGKSGENLIIHVPKGTIIKHAETGKIIHDMGNSEEPYTMLKGGRGGNGNMHYATSVMQAPKYAQPGGKSQEMEVILELKSIADVGLVGFPNVGKSTFLSRVTNARPKIADYHFTTLSPNLGVVDLGETGFVIADIPGLIEGAADGAGLGHEFLRHIERCRILIHLVDAAGTEGRDPVEDISAINCELERYNNILGRKIQVVAANKMDLIYDEDEKNDIISRIRQAFNTDTEDSEIAVFPISAATGEGVKPLLYHVMNLLNENPADNSVFESEIGIDDLFGEEILPYYVKKESEELYSVEGPRIERMLGYTNLESEKGFLFFQNFMREQGILDQLKDLGICEGNTVRVYGHEFEYYND